MDRSIELKLDNKAKDLGYYFDQSAADHVITFIEKFCRQSKGEYAGKPIKLLPWQTSLLTRLYGWKRSDGTRRYRNCGVWVP
jgi:phage terminase large subunit-like protein